MTKEIELLTEEWKKIFDNVGDFYIYGASNNAKDLLSFARKTDTVKRIKGFVVTDIENNPNQVDNYPVISIYDLTNKSVNILVPHAAIYKREIISLLESLDFKNVFSVQKYLYFLAKEKVNVVADEYMNRVRTILAEIETKKSVREKKAEELIRKEVEDLQKKGQADFGGVHFYQSFEQIGIQGSRPTLYRIEKYGINEYLDVDKEVLDIGCNTGFLDMMISTKVKEVTGIEYDSSLVAIAERVRTYVGAENCHFVNADFNDWFLTNKKIYNVIFSFAIHHWLKLEAKEYVEKVDSLLEENGYVCFESHDMGASDLEYGNCIQEFICKGYTVEKQGDIMDDGITKRKYSILKKHK